MSDKNNIKILELFIIEGYCSDPDDDRALNLTFTEEAPARAALDGILALNLPVATLAYISLEKLTSNNYESVAITLWELDRLEGEEVA